MKAINATTKAVRWLAWRAGEAQFNRLNARRVEAVVERLGANLALMKERSIELPAFEPQKPGDSFEKILEYNILMLRVEDDCDRLIGWYPKLRERQLTGEKPRKLTLEERIELRKLGLEEARAHIERRKEELKQFKNHPFPQLEARVWFATEWAADFLRRHFKNREQ